MLVSLHHYTVVDIWLLAPHCTYLMTQHKVIEKVKNCELFLLLCANKIKTRLEINFQFDRRNLQIHLSMKYMIQV